MLAWSLPFHSMFDQLERALLDPCDLLCVSCPDPHPGIAWGSSFKPSFSVLTLPVALGNIQAVALRDIFVQAQNRDSSPPSLQIEEPEWEKRRSVNLSELIDVYRYG